MKPRSLAAVSQASIEVSIIKSEGEEEGEGNIRQRSKNRLKYQCDIFCLCTVITRCGM